MSVSTYPTDAMNTVLINNNFKLVNKLKIENCSMLFSNNDYFALVHDDPMQGIRPSQARMKKFGSHGHESKEDGAGDTTPTTKLIKAPPFPCFF